MKCIVFFACVALAYGRDACDFGCGAVWDPVCGSDGVTYSNQCSLEMADCLSEDEIILAYEGICAEGCQEEWEPVCGTDGITHANLCFLELAGADNDDVMLSYPGECQPPIQNVVAPCDPSIVEEDCTVHAFSPVCEDSGTTYRTMCDLCQTMYEAQAGGENIIYVVDHLGPCENEEEEEYTE